MLLNANTFLIIWCLLSTFQYLTLMNIYFQDVIVTNVLSYMDYNNYIYRTLLYIL